MSAHIQTLQEVIVHFLVRDAGSPLREMGSDHRQARHNGRDDKQKQVLMTSLETVEV